MSTTHIGVSSVFSNDLRVVLYNTLIKKVEKVITQTSDFTQLLHFEYSLPH